MKPVMVVLLSLLVLGSAFVGTANRPGMADVPLRTVTGRVTVAGTGRPVPAVDVSLQGERIRTRTDAAGEYVLEDVPAGHLTVLFRQSCYRATRVDVGRTGGRTVRLDIGLAFNDTDSAVNDCGRPGTPD